MRHCYFLVYIWILLLCYFFGDDNPRDIVIFILHLDTFTVIHFFHFSFTVIFCVNMYIIVYVYICTICI